MVALLVVGFIANLLVRPVADRHHVENQDGAQDESEDTEGAQEDEADAPKTGEPAPKPIVPVPVAWAIAGIPILYGLGYTFINGLQLFIG